MRVISDNWSSVDIEFDGIEFVHYVPASSWYKKDNKEIVICSVSANAHPLEIAHFFRKVADINYSRGNRKIYRNENKLGHFQFRLYNKDYPDFPVKWFTLIFDNGIKIDHDIGSNTTYIKKNSHSVLFYPREKASGKYSKYKELNMKKRAYKFIANQVMKKNEN